MDNFFWFSWKSGMNFLKWFPTIEKTPIEKFVNNFTTTDIIEILYKIMMNWQIGSIMKLFIQHLYNEILVAATGIW